MGKHIQVTEEQIQDGSRKTFESHQHVQRIEDILVNQSGDTLKSILIFGNEGVSEYIKYFSSTSPIILVYQRKITGQGYLGIRAEAVKHVRSLEAKFRYSGRLM
jgi:hypothetical protein